MACDQDVGTAGVRCRRTWIRSGVGVVTTLIGGATVTRAAVAQPQALKMRDDVFVQDRISTKERSVVHILMGGTALLTVGVD